jgi:hypothetical protein
MAKKERPRCAPEDLLTGLPAEIQHLAGELRRLVQVAVPAVEEAGYPGWQLIGYHHRRYFGFIAPKPDRVLLGFEHGLTLPDPAGLLAGSGKQVRYVTLWPGTELPRQPLTELIQIAAGRAATD